MTPPLRRAATVAALAIVVSACAPDPHDVYTVEAPPAARAPLPTTEPPQAADGSDEAEAPAPASFAANGEVAEVRALDNTFRLETIEIEAGTEVLWVNGGRNEHNVLPVDEVADTAGFRVERDDFTPGDEYRYLFDTPGVFPYYCSIHGTQDVGMVGAVVVVEPA